MGKVRISELPYLVSASADVILPVVDNGVTYKTDLNVLETAMVHVLSSSIDNRLDFLETFSASFPQFSSSIDIKIEAATNEQSLAHLITTSSFNSFTQSYYNVSASFDSRIQNHISSTAYISESYTEFVYSYHSESSSFSSRIDAATNEQYIAGLLLTASYNTDSTSFDSRLDGLESFSSSADNRYVLSGSITQTTWDNIANKPNDIISSSTQISDLGFVTGSYTTITSFNNLTQSFNQISQSFTTVSGSFGEIDFSGINSITASYLEFTQSYYSESASFDSRIISGSAVAGTISGSSQIAALGYATTSSVTTISASAWGAFQSASSYSSSLATSISASNYTITINSASVSSLSSSIYLTDVTQSSNFTTLSSSVDSRLDVVEATASLFTPFSTSVDSRLDNQEAFSSSLSVIANSSTKIVDSAWAGAGSWTGTYTGNGGKVLVTAYASGYVGSTGLYSLSLTRDGIVVDTNSFYYNQASTHMVLPPLNYVGYNETGSHTYAIVLNGGIVQDSGDNGTIVVTETFNTLNAGLISSSAQITALGFVSSSTGTPAGTISSSAQIESLGYALTSSVNNLSASIYLTDSTQSNNIVINSASAWGAYTSASAYSASAAATYAIKGGDATFNNLTATTFILSSSVYYVTASYSSGSTIFGNTSDDTHQFTGSVSISGSLTASLSNGYFWVGNSSNKTYEVPTSSFTTTASFNSFTSSYYIDSASAATARNTTSASLASLQLSLGTTSVPFSASSVVNPSSYVLVTYYTASYNGGTMDLIAVDTVNNKATSTNYQFVNAGNGTGIAQNGKASSGAGAPNPALSSDIVSGSVRLKVSDTGTFTFKGVIRLF